MAFGGVKCLLLEVVHILAVAVLQQMDPSKMSSFTFDKLGNAILGNYCDIEPVYLKKKVIQLLLLALKALLHPLPEHVCVVCMTAIMLLLQAGTILLLLSACDCELLR